MTEHKLKIRSFLNRFVQEKEFQDHDDIFAKGFVSSLLAMELILFVEKEFLIRIENDDLKLDNFRSVVAISQLIERKAVKENKPKLNE